MFNKLLKTIIACVACVGLFVIAACGSLNTTFQNNTPDNSTNTVGAATDSTISAKETTAEFSITATAGSYSVIDNVYTLTQAGEYIISGRLDGQIIVNADSTAEVELSLYGTTISCSFDSPIKIVSASKVEISAKKGTDNVIKDLRAAKTADAEDQGNGAIYAKCDLKFKGQGTLVVVANYNNGIHTTKDLKIQNLALKVTAYNNAVKGNDSISVTSGQLVAISTNGDGMRTENTDTNKYGEVRGDISLSGGTISVYSAGDGIQAAHNFEIMDTSSTSPILFVYTGSYSGYTASNADTSSYKGIKVQNSLNVLGGKIIVQSYDDGLHADYGTLFTSGGTGLGTVNISGGDVTVGVFSPENKTATGRPGPWTSPTQQAVSGSDGIHGDWKINISGGTVNIDSSYEGMEGNVITITGGKTYVAANDDGINACKGIQTPLVEITGGYLDVTVSPNVDTDGIDSNGNYSQNGGIVITRGPNSSVASALDADGTVTITGGTLIVLGSGYKLSSSITKYNLILHSIGKHTVKINGVSYTFNNSYGYAKTTVYSSVSISI